MVINSYKCHKRFSIATLHDTLNTTNYTNSTMSDLNLLEKAVISFSLKIKDIALWGHPQASRMSSKHILFRKPSLRVVYVLHDNFLLSHRHNSCFASLFYQSSNGEWLCVMRTSRVRSFNTELTCKEWPNCMPAAVL